MLAEYGTDRLSFFEKFFKLENNFSIKKINKSLKLIYNNKNKHSVEN